MDMTGRGIEREKKKSRSNNGQWDIIISTKFINFFSFFPLAFSLCLLCLLCDYEEMRIYSISRWREILSQSIIYNITHIESMRIRICSLCAADYYYYFQLAVSYSWILFAGDLRIWMGCSRHNEYSKKYRTRNESIRVKSTKTCGQILQPNSFILSLQVGFVVHEGTIHVMRGLYTKYFILFIIWCDNIIVYFSTLSFHMMTMKTIW